MKTALLQLTECEMYAKKTAKYPHSNKFGLPVRKIAFT